MATRQILAIHAITDTARALLRAVYASDFFDYEVRVYTHVDWALVGGPHAKFYAQPEDPTYHVENATFPQPGCWVVHALWSDNASVPPRYAQTYVTLLPLDPAWDPHHYNPTHWVVANMIDPGANGLAPPVDLCTPAVVQGG
jgi:hypothetical protein